MKKACVWKIIPIALLISVFLTACFDPSKPLRVTEVKTLPENFISLTQFQEDHKEILSLEMFHGAVLRFLDLDGCVIEQHLLDDENFLVSYQNEWYIEQEFSERSISGAQMTAEARSAIFEMGEKIDLRLGIDEFFSFELENITCTDEKEGENSLSEKKTYLIETGALDDRVGAGSIVDYFRKVETTDGTVYEDFVEISETSVSIVLPQNETIKLIYVGSPFYPENVRKVKVS